MEAWWSQVGLLNKAFVISAAGFSVLFVWQIISLLAGLDADSHAVGHDGGSFDHSVDHPDTADQQTHHPGGEVTFSLVSVRSIVAFGTLFSWAGALYLLTGTNAILAIVYSAAWGMAAMFGVSYLVYWLLRLQEVGTSSLWSAIGEEGSVYIRIPQDGMGKVRVMVGGVVSYVSARSENNEELAPGALVRVVGVIDDNTIEVRELET